MLNVAWIFYLAYQHETHFAMNRIRNISRIKSAHFNQIHQKDTSALCMQADSQSLQLYSSLPSTLQ